MSTPDAPRPTRHRSWTAAAALLALVVVALAAVLINAAVSGPDTTTAAPDPSGPPTPAPAAGSVTASATSEDGGDRPAGCATTGTDQSVPTATPSGVTWSLVQGFAVPSTTADGPALKGPAGVAYCYSRTPVGALLAASNLGHVTGSPTAVVADLRDHALVENQYTDQLASSSTPGSPGAGAGVQLAGFRVVSYSPDQATVTLAIASAGSTSGSVQLTVALAWSGGDWRVVPQAGPALFVNVGSVTSLSNFVPWSGVA
ncbi:hypothetical protein GCM10027047_16690 [Rhodococcus aerolatus]